MLSTILAILLTILACCAIAGLIILMTFFPFILSGLFLGILIGLGVFWTFIWIKDEIDIKLNQRKWKKERKGEK